MSIEERQEFRMACNFLFNWCKGRQVVNSTPLSVEELKQLRQAIDTITINTREERILDPEIKLQLQDQIISAFSKLAGGEKSYEFAFKQVRYQTEELLHIGVCSIYYNKF